jgi:threonine dehydratase
MYRISQLSAEERKRGIICMSAGNHAQGVALAAKRLNIKATIVMPTSASEIKYTNVRRLGSTVILCGADLEEAKKECLRLASEHGHIFVPPFDDPYIIAGQGTAGMEIIRQIRRGERLDAIFVPVGGGGLLAGIAAFMKRVQPSVKIIGVNTVDSSSMAVSLERGLRTALPTVGLFSDGTAVREIGAETYRICNDLVDDMVLVTVDEICAAIKDVFDDTRSILEPSGALGVAGIKKFLQDRGKHLCGGTFVAVTSGANMNFDRLRFVAERSRIGEGRECLLSCRVEEKPGR